MVYLQEVGKMQNPIVRVSFYTNGFPISHGTPLHESQGSSQLHGHSHWLMCEVALNRPRYNVE